MSRLSRISSGRSHHKSDRRCVRPLDPLIPELTRRRVSSRSARFLPHLSTRLRNRGKLGRVSHRPFEPPEDYYEPNPEGPPQPGEFRIVRRPPGAGFQHVVTPAEIRQRLSKVPLEFLSKLERVQLCQMTRKKRSLPCYGMQWATTLYLYPMEVDLTERYGSPPEPAQLIEARMYGGRWVQVSPYCWQLQWSTESIRDFYLNNILIHELGHLVDDRNTRSSDRERFAEWFALQYGYQATQPQRRRRLRATR